MRRVGALASFAAGWSVTGAIFDPHGQAHLGHGCAEVAFYVGSQRLERRDVDGVQAGLPGLGHFDQAG